MDGLEGHAAFLDVGRDSVDDSIRSRHGGSDRGLIADVGAQDGDPVQVDRVQDAARPF
jgi:hypothetical protein